MPTATFKSTVNLIEGMHCQANVRNFTVAMDEPPSLGGTDKAMNPVEMLLCALGGCLVISSQAFSRECGVNLKNVSVELEGDLDPDGFLGKNPDIRAGLQDTRVKIHFDTDSPDENIEKLMQTIEKRCPVSDCLKGQPVPVRIEYVKS